VGGPHVPRLAAIADRLAGVVLNGLARIIVLRPAGLGIEAGRPVHLGERLALEELAAGAVPGVEETVAVGLRDDLARLAIDVGIVELRDRDRVIVPGLVRNSLEVPLQLAGLDIERD